MRLTVEEYSQYFKISKEMVELKIRTKKLNYIIDNSITYIIVSRKLLESIKRNNIEVQKKEQMQTPATTTLPKPKSTVAMILGLYQKENRQLKEKIVQLEAKIDKLIDDKEQMLRDEMRKIEEVHREKERQFKMILELLNTKFSQKEQNSDAEIQDVEIQNYTIEDANSMKEKKYNQIVELKSYLKRVDLENAQRKIIKKRFMDAYGSDIRVIKQNGKFYLNFSKYDYSDLLEC